MEFIVITYYLGDEPTVEKFNNEEDLEKYYAEVLKEAKADKEKIRASSIVSVEILRAEIVRKTVYKE